MSNVRHDVIVYYIIYLAFLVFYFQWYRWFIPKVKNIGTVLSPTVWWVHNSLMTWPGGTGRRRLIWCRFHFWKRQGRGRRAETGKGNRWGMPAEELMGWFWGCMEIHWGCSMRAQIMCQGCMCIGWGMGLYIGTRMGFCLCWNSRCKRILCSFMIRITMIL